MQFCLRIKGSESAASLRIKYSPTQTVAQQLRIPDQVWGSRHYAGRVDASVSRHVQSGWRSGLESRQKVESIRTLQIANASKKTRSPRQHTPLRSISTAQPGGQCHSVDTQFCCRLTISLARVFRVPPRRFQNFFGGHTRGRQRHP